jgi:hypothetical protein
MHMSRDPASGDTLPVKAQTYVYFVQELNDRSHSAHAGYSISCYSPFKTAWLPCVFCAGIK